MKLRQAFVKLHLWLGFGSGLVVFIVSITGCIYAFQEEIKSLTEDYLFVVPQQTYHLPPSHIKEVAQNTLADKKIHSVLYHRAKEKSAIVSFYSFESDYYFLVYINPYTGKVLKVKDMNNDFFRIVLKGHMYSWLPADIGKPIVASSTVVFVVMLISGIILWWPKNKAATKQRFSIKWSAKWRRKNYDLHNVLGFYAALILFFIAITGLVWGFEWFAKSSYFAVSGGKQFLDYYEPTSDTAFQGSFTEIPTVDKVWKLMLDEHQDSETFEIHFPETAASPILAAMNFDSHTYWKIDYRFFDQYSLKELSVEHLWGRFNQAILADKIFRMNYDIHVGAILGLPGKCLAFFASLIAASLPITGFCIWWGRRNKLKKDLIKVSSNTRYERKEKLKALSNRSSSIVHP